MLRISSYERAYYTVGVTILFVVLYFGAAQYGATVEHRPVVVPFDQQIPFIAHSVWIYVSAVPLIVLPAFVLRSGTLVRRTAISYGTALAVCFVVFVAYPTSSLSFRSPLTDLESPSASEWLVRLIYTVDPPYNMFPSLHVALSVCGAAALWNASKTAGLMGAAWAIGVAVSVCTTKQHFVLDAVGGTLIGMGSSMWTRGGAHLETRARSGCSLRGMGVWCFLTGAAYVALLVAYLGR